MASSRTVAFVLVSGCIHVLAYVQMSHAKASMKVAPGSPVILEVDTAPPPPERSPVESKPEPTPEPTAAKMEPAVVRPALAIPRPAAQAGKVVAAKDDGNAVADFTMVQGSADAYAGGITSSSGTSRSVVNERSDRRAAAALGAGVGNGTGAAIGAADQSKTARPIGSDWDCKALFPGTATTDTATVIIVARVRADGAPESISVVADPGQGFGAAARACAMRQRYDAARDREGRPASGSTAPFRVRFTR